MAQFDVYINTDRNSADRTPYLLDVQAEILSELVTRVVIPLRAATNHHSWVISRLHPIITVAEDRYVAVVSEIAGIPMTLLGESITNVRHQRSEIVTAVDLMITGF